VAGKNQLTETFRSAADGLILSINPGHDGAIALLKGGTLLASYEAEHDSRPRHMPVNAYALLDTLCGLGEVPSVIATSGWQSGWPFQSASTPYHGVSDEWVRLREASILGARTVLMESTHERSHIFSSYGLSPFEQGEPCYVLVWEGELGCFYEIDREMRIKQHGPVLPNPGYKYAFLFDLADPSVKLGTWRLDNAGKLMALAGFSKRAEPTPDEESVIARLLEEVSPPTTPKQLFTGTLYFNCGVTEPRFCELVSLFSNRLFEIFHSYARLHLQKGYPLLIAGGCGLNCDWNSKWRDCGLFRDVFVPPVTNDSGCAIGTAVEAQYLVTGCAKISWNVYSGSDFVSEDGHHEDFFESSLDFDQIAALLLQDKVIAWAQGRSEIGPRALGNRSLLASPFRLATKERLNRIKQREWYRPIAPVCLEEDAHQLFGVEGSSPYMLYFQRVRRPELEAITHVDGSARVQTVNRQQNPTLYELLSAFKRRTGFGVLCNTSLNRKGEGFINRSNDLFDYARQRGIEVVVVNSRSYLRQAVRATDDSSVRSNCR
jgi:predicted NodU family carbamoyl transferase